jgi:hypothetical protein
MFEFSSVLSCLTIFLFLAGLEGFGKKTSKIRLNQDIFEGKSDRQ